MELPSKTQQLKFLQIFRPILRNTGVYELLCVCKNDYANNEQVTHTSYPFLLCNIQYHLTGLYKISNFILFIMYFSWHNRQLQFDKQSLFILSAMWLWSKRTEYFPKLKLTHFVALLAVLDKILQTQAVWCYFSVYSITMLFWLTEWKTALWYHK